LVLLPRDILRLAAFAPRPNYVGMTETNDQIDVSELEGDALVAAAAASLMQQYGDDAEVVATLRAAEFAAAGDVDALHAWDAIIAYLKDLRECKAAPQGGVVN
jgi:hypothetical protein